MFCAVIFSNNNQHPMPQFWCNITIMTERIRHLRGFQAVVICGASSVYVMLLITLIFDSYSLVMNIFGSNLKLFFFNRIKYFNFYYKFLSLLKNLLATFRKSLDQKQIYNIDWNIRFN